MTGRMIPAALWLPAEVRHTGAGGKLRQLAVEDIDRRWGALRAWNA